MKIIDLSHLNHPKMPVYPETESPFFQFETNLKEHGFRETKMILYSHIGTHLDAPGHMLEKGSFLEKMNIEHFYGKATMLNFTNYKNKSITLKYLKTYEDRIRKVEFVIINTGWSRYWTNQKYYTDYPFLNCNAAKWLARFNLKGVGIDTISIDKSGSEVFGTHKILLSKNIIIIENLTNLATIESDYFTLSVFPIKYQYSDGSPVRAVAIEDNC